MGDMLSQAEINALLGGLDTTAPAPEATKPVELTDEQRDILGEIGNISMGTSATTLFALLGQKVWITTPKVSLIRWNELANDQDRPCVGIRVNYTEGIEGANVLILKQSDVKTISSLMMGGNGLDDVDGELTELDFSAISEAMNQMVGSSSTSLSSLIKTRIDIDTPKAFLLDLNDDFISDLQQSSEYVICTAFRMEIGTLVDSEIMQVIPLDMGLHIAEVFRNELFATSEPKAAPAAHPVPSQHTPAPVQQSQPVHQEPVQQSQPVYQQPVQQPQMYQEQPHSNFAQNVNAKPVQFQSFDFESLTQQKDNINIIMDVPLEVTVELGRTSKKIKEILEFTAGSIIELDKLAGEPIDVLVNGKFVAKGEVVVIDENFCIRITDVISVEKRI